MRWLSILILMNCSTIFSADIPVSNASGLDSALRNAKNGDQILFTQDIDLTHAFNKQLFPVNSYDDFVVKSQTITINGNNHQLIGGEKFRGFFLCGGDVIINDLICTSTIAKGGNGGEGGAGGGGGAGIGGAFFVSKDTIVTLKNPSFIGANAVGGDGGLLSGIGNGGGGGAGGDGGNSIADRRPGGGGGGGLFYHGGHAVSKNGGGGGGGGVGSFGRDSSNVHGGDGGDDFSGQLTGGKGGDPGKKGGNGPKGSGGGGGGGPTGNDRGGGGGTGGIGAGGGGGGSSAITPGENGEHGGMFGGGGGGGTDRQGADGIGGNGGFGAGGGGGKRSIGGKGGYGGGGAGGQTPGGPGYGGGAGEMEGGGGAGFGGAIFMQDGSMLTIKDSAHFANNAAVPGKGPHPGSKAGSDIFMMAEASLTFDLSTGLTLSHPIEGDQGAGGGSTINGGLTKKGNALLIIEGENTYTGQTNVEGGELRIKKSVITDVHVSQGAVLSGDFTVKKNSKGTNQANLVNSGRVCPGVSGVGKIHIEGDFINEATGTLITDITPDGRHDKVNIQVGKAVLDGTLEINLGRGNYIAGTKYQIIGAPTNGTEFTHILKTGLNADKVEIQVEYGSVIITILNDVIFDDDDIYSGPAKKVAKNLANDTLTPGSDLAIIVELLGTLDDSALNEALTSLTPIPYATFEWIHARNMSYVADLLAQHQFQVCELPEDCYCECDLGNCSVSFWLNPFGIWMENTKRYNYLNPFSAESGGILAGMDYCFSCLYLGASFGYTFTHFEWENEMVSGHTHSYFGALYGSFQSNYLNIDFSAIGGGADQDLSRKMIFSTIDRKAKSDFWSLFMSGHLGFQVNWCCGASTIEPFALVDYHWLHDNKFKESGADSLNLIGEAKDQHFLRAEGGLNWTYTFVGEDSSFTPYFGLSYVGEFPLNKSVEKARFQGQTLPMKIEVYNANQHLGSPQGGVKWTYCNGLSFILGYKGLFNKRTTINQVEGRLEWVF